MKISRNIRRAANSFKMGTRTIVPSIKQIRMRKRSFERNKGVVGGRPVFMPPAYAIIVGLKFETISIYLLLVLCRFGNT
jgi:hypothetical protein